MGKNNKKKAGNKKTNNSNNKNNSTDGLNDGDILELAMKENESYVPPVKKAFTLPPTKDDK